MIGFLKKISPFVLLLIFVLAFTEWFSRTSKNDITFKKELINKKGIEGVILGTSHNYFGIHPEKMKSASIINLAYPGQSLNYDAFIATKVAKNPSIKFAFVELSYHSLPYALHLSKGGIEHSLYNHYWEYDTWYDNNIIKRLSTAYSNGLSMSFRRAIKSLIKPNYSLVRCNNLGSGNREKNEDLKRTAEVDSKRHNSLFINQPEIIEESKSHIQNILDILSKNEIKPIILIPPCHREYRSRLDKKNFEIFQNQIEIYEKQNVKVWDCMDLYRNTDSLFSDSDHLNEKGAKVFSEYLDQRISNEF